MKFWYENGHLGNEGPINTDIIHVKGHMTLATPTCYDPAQLDGFAYLLAASSVEEIDSVET